VSHQSSRSALVITFDRFPASILGCYGNEWIETPHLDRLAAGGIVGESCWAAAVGPTTAERAFAFGSGGFQPPRDIRTRLIYEADSQIDFTAAGFDQITQVSGELGTDAKPDRIPFAAIVRQAKTDWQAGSPLLWLQARGLSIPAEPPAGFADLYQDEFEDRSLNFAELSAAEQAGHPLVTAGMVSLLDHWLGELLTNLPVEQPTLIVVTAAQGAIWQPLPNSFGELDTLRSQAAHVPWLMQFRGCEPNAAHQGQRLTGIMSTRDLGPLLSAWFAGEEEVTNYRAALSTGSAMTLSATGPVRITTERWSAIFPGTGAALTSAPAVLFARPEDAWEVNNQAIVMFDVLDELRQQLNAPS